MKKLLDIRYLYYGKSNRKWFARKIGIATNKDRRWSAIDREITGSREEVVFSVLIPFAYITEQFLLFLTLPFKTKMPGSGKTEWRRIGFLDGIMVLIYLFCFVVCWGLLVLAGSWAVYIIYNS